MRMGIFGEESEGAEMKAGKNLYKIMGSNVVGWQMLTSKNAPVSFMTSITTAEQCSN